MRYARMILLAVALAIICDAAHAATEAEIRGARGLSSVCVRVNLYAPTLKLSFTGDDIAKAAETMLREKLPRVTALENSVPCPDRLYIVVNLLRNEGKSGASLGTAGNLEVSLHRPVFLEDKNTRVPFAALWHRSVLFLNGPKDDLFAYIEAQLEKKLDEFAQLVSME